MQTKNHYFKIGLFVLLACLFGVSTIIIFGAGELFRPKVMVETYFQESVQGLDVGSKIKFRGVQIGNVEEINVVANNYKSKCLFIMVRCRLYADALPMPVEELLEEKLINEINRGLRIRLAFQGITGTAYLEADYLEPERNPVLQISWLPKYPYIPSAPSTITRISESIDRIMRNLEKINMVTITDNVQNTLTGITRFVNELSDIKLGEKSSILIDEVRATNSTINQFMTGKHITQFMNDSKATIKTARTLIERLEKLSKDLPETSSHLNRAMRRLDDLLFSQHQDIEVTIDNIRTITDNFKELSNNAKKYPSLFLFGEPPAKFYPENQFRDK